MNNNDIQDIIDSIIQAMGAMEKRIDKKFDDIDKRFDDIEKSINEKLEAIDKRFDVLEEKIEVLEEVAYDVDIVKARVNKNEYDIKKIKNNLTM